MTQLIEGYTNYTISDAGEVRNIETNKVLKGSIGEHGYRYYRLSKDGQKTMFYGHRLVAEAFLPNPDNLPVVNHKDGNKLNNCVSNLEWVTYHDNTVHAHRELERSAVRARTYYEGDLDGEEWLQIFNLPYSVSNKGRIRNDRNNLLLKPSLTCGYYKVRLSVDGKVADKMVHNLVYCLFNHVSEIPEGYVIDHIDGNKLNNNSDNLRLITLSENVKAALYETGTNKSCRKVCQYKDGKLVGTFPSTREAGRVLGLDSSSISKVCRGVQKTCGGFTFTYEDETSTTILKEASEG